MKAIEIIKGLKNKAKFARAVGISPQLLNHWIAKDTIPTSKHLPIVAKELKLKIEELY